MDPFGTTRSRVRRDHALIAPDSFVAAPLPGWRSAKGVVLVAPADGGAVRPVPRADGGRRGRPAPAAAGVERVVFVLEGEVEVELGRRRRPRPRARRLRLLPAGRRRAAAGDVGRAGSACSRSGTCRSPGVDPPGARVGHEQTSPGEPFLGDPDALLQVLLPDEPAFDLAVNVFTYQPGATLPMVEVHVMEHGLLMLEGQGVYRLGDSWYPVREGDAIWMAPYCPQWFVAMGKGPARISTTRT